MSKRTPKILLVAGYLDWFSGYQETSIAKGLAAHGDLTIVTSNRVSPIFSDAHLANIGVARVYARGASIENGHNVHRFPVTEHRAMVWSSDALRFVRQEPWDLVVEVMPGQGLPLVGTFTESHARVVLYGDNSAMYADLPRALALIKRAVFSATKGPLYHFTNRRATAIFGYTPETQRLLRFFAPRRRIDLLPLTVDFAKFRPDQAVRAATRAEFGIDNETVAIAPGKVQPQKRIDAVIHAVASSASGIDRLFIVGTDMSPASGDLRQLAKTLGVTDRITFLPFVDADRLNSLLNAADIGVWPAMPAITIQQAMATGLPVVIPRNGFTSHLFREGSGAIEIAPGDQLAKSICIATAEALSAPVDRPAGSRVNEWFSAASVAGQLAGYAT